MYFDASATTPLDQRVKEAMLAEMDIFGNENSKHCYGFEAQKRMDQYMATIAKVLGVLPDQLAVTYSGTDSNRKAMTACMKRFGKESMYASAVEHSSVADEFEAFNVFDPAGSDWNKLKDPKFLALMQANSETGVVYPADKLRAQFPEAIILRDYSQSFAKGLMPDFKNTDFGTFAPQKIYGPKMVGLLYIKQPEMFTEVSKDSHTKNLFLVAGMAKAFEIWDEERKVNMTKLAMWQQQIEDTIKNEIGDYKIHGVDQERIIGVTNVAFKGVRGSELMALLSTEEEIAISTGSACNSDLLSPTEVIQYIEKDPTWQYPVRISLHKFLTDDDVNDFCEILTHYVSELRSRNI